MGLTAPIQTETLARSSAYSEHIKSNWEYAESAMETSSKILENLHISNYSVYLPHVLNYLNKRKKNFQAGCISDASLLWRKLTSDLEILDTVHGMHIEFNELPVQFEPCFQSFIANKNHTLGDDETSSLIEKKVIVTSTHEPGEFFHQYFFKVKKMALFIWC